MALINEISRKFPLFSPAQAPHLQPHTHSGMPHLSLTHNKPNPVRWTTGHTPIRTDKTIMALWPYFKISRKFPLFSPAQAPHLQPPHTFWDASPFTDAQRTQPGPLDHRTHPYMDGQDYMALWPYFKISRKFPLFSPAQAPHLPPPHIFGCLTFHRGIMNQTQSVTPQHTPLEWTNTRTAFLTFLHICF